jgi:hypothetical protein
MEAWREMGDPRAASPILCEDQRRLGAEPACNELDDPQDEPGGHSCRTRFATRPPGTLYGSSGR